MVENFQKIGAIEISSPAYFDLIFEVNVKGTVKRRSPEVAEFQHDRNWSPNW